MTKGENGIWSGTTSRPVRPGAWRYTFSVDGITVVDSRNVNVTTSQTQVQSLLMVPGDFSESRDVPRVPEDLVGHEAVLGTFRTAPSWDFARSRRGAVRIAARLRTDDIETRLGAVREGRGIGQFLSYQVADDLEAGRLVRLLRAYEQQAIPVHLLTKGRTNRAPKVDAFLDFAARRLLALPVLMRERVK